MILALKQICNHPAQFLKNGDTRIELSGKAEMLLDRLDGIVANGEKCLYSPSSAKWANCWCISSKDAWDNAPCSTTADAV